MAYNAHLESDTEIASEPHGLLKWKGTGATRNEGDKWAVLPCSSQRHTLYCFQALDRTSLASIPCLERVPGPGTCGPHNCQPSFGPQSPPDLAAMSP